MKHHTVYIVLLFAADLKKIRIQLNASVTYSDSPGLIWFVLNVPALFSLLRLGSWPPSHVTCIPPPPRTSINVRCEQIGVDIFLSIEWEGKYFGCYVV